MREAVLARAGSRWRTRNTTAGRSRTAPPSADQAAAARNKILYGVVTEPPPHGARIETRARPFARALDRHRGKGQQQITVKHVTVNADQAVVADTVVGGSRDP